MPLLNVTALFYRYYMKITNNPVISLSGIKIRCNLQFQDTAGYLRTIIQDECIDAAAACEDAVVSEQQFADWVSAGNRKDAYGEFCLLCMPISEALLQHGRCLFHAAAVSYKGRAWLIAAGSGTGKSTQCRNLTTMYPDEFIVINGDKPVIKTCDDGSVIVHPSPWNGKEGWHGAAAAPLAGIVLLRRGTENSLVRVSEEKAAWQVFLSVFQSYTDDQAIRMAAAIAEKIIKSSPIWIMTSHTVPDSTKLLYECILKESMSYGLQD